jgi:two-component sensor histidine kinase
MQTPKLPGNELQRLQAVREHRILDTPAEATFDGITKLAARLLGVPIALISIIDADRQWFKSRFGLSAPHTPRDISFCGHVVEHDCPVIVPDAREDMRFADNPLVTGDPKICFYAGMPLRTSEGHVLGTLCVIDHIPKLLSSEDREALEILAAQVIAQLELRRRNLILVNQQKNQQELQQQSRSAVKSQNVLQQVMHLHLHRNLQLAAELIEMQVSSLPQGETRTALKACVGRLHALAAVHMPGDRNYRSVSLANYVRRVAQDVFEAFQPTPGQLRFECTTAEMELPIETAIPCGLVLNELIANAATHAFPNGRPGSIQVAVSRVGSDDLQVCVTDDGVGLPSGFDPRTAASIGMRTLVALANRLNAQIDTNTTSGTSFTMTFPWNIT